jgi:hypothetical protein
VAKVGTSKAGGTISQQSAVHPWLAADAHGNKQTNKQTNNALKGSRDIAVLLLFSMLNCMQLLPAGSPPFPTPHGKF